MSELNKNIISFWNEADLGTRIGFGFGAGVILLMVGFMAYWALRSDYQALFTDLDARDAAVIVEELKRAKVPYRIGEGGSKILVKEDAVHETRLSLMGRGLPISGGVGFEIFDNKDVGMTEYAQKINYQRALQGELARTIMAFDLVKFARVHLVVAESSIFKRDKVRPKASVSLVVKPGGQLSNEQIAGIQRLIAASVPGLNSNMVTVLDQRGVTLSAAVDGDDNAAMASSKLRLKREVETYLSLKVGEIMDRAFGPGQAIVSVDATLNFDQVSRTFEEIIPTGSNAGGEGGMVVRKRQSVYRQSKGGATRVVNGDPEYAAGASPALNSTTEVEYELSKRIEQIVSTPGGIRRVSVGVIVPRPMGAKQLEHVREIVSTAFGFNAGRGDVISVQSLDQLVPQKTAVSNEAPTPSAEAIGPTDSAPAPAADPQRSLHWPQWMSLSPANHWLWIVAFAVSGIAVAIGWIIGRIAATRGAASAGEHRRALTEAERRQKLAEISAWIEAERAAPGATKG